MRITDSILRNAGLSTLKSAMARVALHEGQLASGKQFSRISDNPLDAQAAVRAREQQGGIERFQRNLMSANNRLSLEESVLSELSAIIEDARQIGLSEGSATRNATTRAGASLIVDGMVDHVMSLANSRIGNDYVFSGRQIDTPPFDTTGTYVGDADEWPVEIDRGMLLTPNTNGQTLFIDSDLLPALRELSLALASDDPGEILATSERLSQAFDVMQNLLADLGGKQNIAASTQYLHEENYSDIRIRLSRIEDTDVAETLVELANAQNSLDGAFAATREGMRLNIIEMLGM